ncbi:hypothetical protein LINPERPRIM_LOCUS5886, partial [Linum perenne]
MENVMFENYEKKKFLVLETKICDKLPLVAHCIPKFES